MGPMATEHQFPFRTPVACLVRSAQPPPPHHRSGTMGRGGWGVGGRSGPRHVRIGLTPAIRRGRQNPVSPHQSSGGRSAASAALPLAPRAPLNLAPPPPPSQRHAPLPTAARRVRAESPWEGRAEFPFSGGGVGGGGWNPKVQTFVYQKQPKSTFPFVKLLVFQQ